MNARVRERVRRALILADDFAHHANGVSATVARVARGSDETKIAETVFDAAQATVPTAIKVDLAGSGRNASAFEMSFEGDHGRAMRLRSVSMLAQTTGQCSRPSRSIDRYWGAVCDFASTVPHRYAANAFIVEGDIGNLRIF